MRQRRSIATIHICSLLCCLFWGAAEARAEGKKPAPAKPSAGAPAGAAPCSDCSVVTWTSSVSQRLTVRLSRPPSTRIRLSLDSETEHLELEWEPNLPDALVKHVTLAPDTWRFSFWAEPILHIEGGYGGRSSHLMLDLNRFNRETWNGKEELIATGAFYDALQVSSPDGGPSLRYLPLPPIEVTFTATDLPALRSRADLGAESLSPAPLQDARGFTDPLLPGVQTTFELLAEIALERAQTRGMDLLRRQITSRLCDKLTWNEILPKDPDRSRLLPRTCTVIESLRLQDVASAARPVLRALREDLVWSITPHFIERIRKNLGWTEDMSRLYDKLMAIAVDVAAGRRPTREHARLVLLELARQSWVQSSVVSRIENEDLRTAVRMSFPIVETTSGAKSDAELLPLVEKDIGEARQSTLLRALAGGLNAEIAPFSEDDQRRFLEAIKGALAQGHESLVPDLERCDRNCLEEHTSALLEKLSRGDSIIAGDKFPQALVATRSLTLVFLRQQVPLAVCGLQLVFAALAQCGQNSTCTAADVLPILQNPHEHFTPFSAGLESLCWQAGRFVDVARVWPDLDVFASRALAVLAPAASTSDAEVVSEAVALFFDAAERLHCNKRPSDCAGEPAFEKLQGVRGVVEAMIARDVSAVLLQSGRLFALHLDCQEKDERCKKSLEKLRRATALIGAVTAYAATFDDEKQGEEAAKAAREARKQAIESLIDTATDRGGRGGEWISSIGANVGFTVFGRRHVRGDEGDLSEVHSMSPQLQLPMGLVLQKLPGHPEKVGTGVHFQLSLIDLGQFVATDEGEVDEIAPADFVMLGGQLGVIIGKPTMPFVIGLDARWSPTQFAQEMAGAEGTEKAGAFSFGLFASYYVPFFDLN